ncbi:hypothetical protein [Hymenobacter cellulosilyticus]|uniref:Uncharacterized protein n=1 Tax=Hymenobacter cellulosilyticus TaxID=2932248 RepID=A0A8T9Q2S7_9BACT|nr:hypothetical protein [Hymenobacter cellulosilyticus]UOQ72026.1 hypothetical protein MUN79_26170 [Hymenobacter cellulosilyticus]
MAALRTLAGVLEPVKEYKRHFQGFTYTPTTPLTRLVDAAPAESEAARQFGVAVEGLNQYLELAPAAERFKGASSKALLSFLNSQLRTWESNDQKLQPLLLKGSSLWEYAPLSTQLRLLSALGLERLQMLEKGQKPSAAWQATALKQLDAAKAPRVRLSWPWSTTCASS